MNRFKHSTRAKLLKYVVASDGKHTRESHLHFPMSELTPVRMKRFFDALLLDDVSYSNRVEIKNALGLALHHCYDRLPNGVSEYFIHVKLTRPKGNATEARTRKETQRFDHEMVMRVIGDESKDLQDRLLVAFCLPYCADRVRCSP